MINIKRIKSISCYKTQSVAAVRGNIQNIRRLVRMIPQVAALISCSQKPLTQITVAQMAADDHADVLA